MHFKSNFGEMSTRSFRPIFEPGEICLCFEPDPTKARVLYDAKVLEIVNSRDKKGGKKCEYHVHFQGWNSSWDRIVPASFVLKNSTENRQLMKLLASTVREGRKKTTLKRKIDQINKVHLKGDIPKFDSDSDSDTDRGDKNDDNDENDDDDNDDDADDDTDQDSSDDDVITYNPRGGYRSRHSIIPNFDDSTEEETEDLVSVVEDDSDPFDGLNHAVGEVDLEIPGNLQRKLEDDCYNIMRKNKVIMLPCDPNVVTILEGYVKNFAVNVLCATVDKLRPRDTYPPPPDKNIELCKEVMDGLRVIFDFVLPKALLYSGEKSQYHKTSSTFSPSVSSQHNSQIEYEERMQSPKLRSSSKHPPSPSYDEPSPKIPRLSPKIKQESDDETGPSRRMTRHAYQEEVRRSREFKLPPRCIQNGARHDGSDGEPSPGGTESPRRRNRLRSSARSMLDITPRNGTLADRVTPPPPLLIPSAINCNKTNSSGCSTPTLPDGGLSDKEGALNSVLAWKLIRDETYYDQTPTPASLIYGANHLLRLFVQLPHVLSQMAIPNTDFSALHRHLELFLDYLSDRCEELLPDGVYGEAMDTNSPTNKSRR